MKPCSFHSKQLPRGILLGGPGDVEVVGGRQEGDPPMTVQEACAGMSASDSRD